VGLPLRRSTSRFKATKLTEKSLYRALRLEKATLSRFY
jgi:hypothetical protein